MTPPPARTAATSAMSSERSLRQLLAGGGNDLEARLYLHVADQVGSGREFLRRVELDRRPGPGQRDAAELAHDIGMDEFTAGVFPALHQAASRHLDDRHVDDSARRHATGNFAPDRQLRAVRRRAYAQVRNRRASERSTNAPARASFIRADEALVPVHDQLRCVHGAAGQSGGVETLARRRERTTKRIAPTEIVPVVDVKRERVHVLTGLCGLACKLREQGIRGRTARTTFGGEEFEHREPWLARPRIGPLRCVIAARLRAAAESGEC